MNFYEAIEATITKTEAIQEIELHDANTKDFFAEYGEKEEYKGSDILNWLGY